MKKEIESDLREIAHRYKKQYGKKQLYDPECFYLDEERREIVFCHAREVKTGLLIGDEIVACLFGWGIDAVKRMPIIDQSFVGLYVVDF